MRCLGLGRSAVLPLFTGVFLGIAYGAGIIIRSAAAGQMDRRELFLTGLFLATCHAVIEDVLIFVVLGGDGVVMLGLRLCPGNPPDLPAGLALETCNRGSIARRFDS